MKEREQLEQAIAALEAQRSVLGDTVVEEALASLREKLAALNKPTSELFTELGRVEAGETASLTSERRVVTILFCDVKGSTAMAEQLDPEEWAGIIQRALEYLTEPVRRHGGTVAEVRGDGILAFFGAPVAHEDDPQRSVIAGLEILEGILVFQEQIKRERGLEFQVRVGIHTGLVVAGEVGKGQQVEYTAIGDTVNLAARMEQTARPGTVQISAQTHRLIEHMFECEPLGEIQVKGKRQPVRTFQVKGLKGKPGPLRGLERQGLRSPLVGREAEYTALRDCIERLFTGQGGIVSIIGEAGVGKSRLLAEIQRAIPSEGLDWLEGHTLSFGQTISYWPFQEILRGYAGINDQDGEDPAWDKLERKTTALFPENTVDILPYLASLIGLRVKGNYLERVKYLDGEALGKQIFLTSRRFFERLAHNRPVVLVFEDLHWMDESSVSLLEHLLPLIERVPLLIVGLSRPDWDTPAAHLGEVIAKDHPARYTEIQLAPLSQSDSTQLVHNLLEIEDLPGRVRQMIVSKAEGNPFFLEEILRALIDLGAIRRDTNSGRWRATARIETLTVPDTIQGVILARLDRLEEGVKHVLRVASVIGRSFLYRVLREIAESGQQLDEHLAELLHIELIQEKRRMPELEYLFNHALAQEATYESILLQKRRELHARVGNAMEMLFGDRLEEFYGLLAHHFARAEAWEKAQFYLLKAGDQAGSIAADAEALNHYRQAMTAYEHAFGSRLDPLQQAVLSRKMGQALVRRGEHSKAFNYLTDGLAHLGYQVPSTRWGIRRAILRELVRQAGHRLLPGRYPKQAAGPPGQPVEEEAQLYIELLQIAVLDDPELFLMLALRLINFSEGNGFLPGVVMGASAFGAAADFVPIFALAERYHHYSVALADQIQHPHAVGIAYQLLTLHEFYLGEWAAALEHGHRSTEAHHHIGGLHGWGWATYLMACTEIYCGNFPQAQKFGQDLIQFGQDGADLLVLCLGHDVLGFVSQRIGQLEAAISHQQKAIELAEAVPDILTRIGAGAKLGQSYLRQGKLQPALEILEASYRLSLEHKEPHHFATLCNAMAEAYLLAAEQFPVGEPERIEWMKKAERACLSAIQRSNAFRGRRPEALRLQGRYAWLQGKAEQAQRWWQKCLSEAETLGSPYELGLTHLEIGQRLGEGAPQERAHIEKAESIFAEIGAELDLARARELLKNY